MIFSLLLFAIIVSAFRLKGEYYTKYVFKNEYKNDINVIRYCKQAENIFYNITPNTLPLKWFQGVAESRIGKQSEALISFKQAFRYTPFEVRLLNDLATAYYKTNNRLLAKSFFKKSIEIDAYFDDAKFNLSAMYFEENKLDSALFFIKRCQPSSKKDMYQDEISIKITAQKTNSILH